MCNYVIVAPKERHKKYIYLVNTWLLRDQILSREEE